jgi:hypothetical protein
MWFLYVEWQTRWVPDTRPKPDGYMYEFLPVGTDTGTNFYPQPLCWRTGNYSTRTRPVVIPSGEGERMGEEEGGKDGGMEAKPGERRVLWFQGWFDVLLIKKRIGRAV